jgi:hypothetical protein
MPIPSSGGEPGPDRSRSILLASGVVVVALIVIGLITYSKGEDNRAAQDKAAQLTQTLEQEGLRVPKKQETLVNWLGDDGGAVCENPASALGKATLADQLTNGASFVGRRVIIIDERVLKGEAAILKVYCPDKLAAYQNKVDEYKTDDTLKD